MLVIKRDGAAVEYRRERIQKAVSKAFAAANANPSDVDHIVDAIEDEITRTFIDAPPRVEEIQDIAERQLVGRNLYTVAKRYMLYREHHRELREHARQTRAKRAARGALAVVKRDGRRVAFDIGKVQATYRRAAAGIEQDISLDLLTTELYHNIFDGIGSPDMVRAMILSAIAFIERDPSYGILAARLVRWQLYGEVFGRSWNDKNLQEQYRRSFMDNVRAGIANAILDQRLERFDLARLTKRLRIERDDLLCFPGTQTLYERYFIRQTDRCIETPQAFWMRVAMGLALNEHDPDERVAEFYDLLSTLRFVSSTPTLFHAGLARPQLSSCYISMVQDDLSHIFKVIADNAQLSKWSGGVGNDWSSIRATGARIKSINVDSQGVIPFLKIANDTTVAINRSGKRRGATCAYLETWHLDIEDFLDLRRNTGDDRRRTHDMNTANWIPDLFMQRVRERRSWTLFSPDETPDLHDLYGRAFATRYTNYERAAQAGVLRQFKVVKAVALWRKMLTRLFETGHPWITFKDPCNIRSPQDHCGVVHNSNLCTEITLNNSADETAVCNLGSLNLAQHTTPDGLDVELLIASVRSAMRMLDNVIDINFYPTAEARVANMRHRPVGLGLMGLQDALFIQRIPFQSEEALLFVDRTMETIAYWAIMTSSQLARERGAYESYVGSKWDRGIFPIDTLDLLEQERGAPIDVPRTGHLEWGPLRDHVRQHGMRNSNTMAIAPTATISNIAHCFPCIEPIYKNIYVKVNMSGEFTVVNEYLIADLKRLGLWNTEMLEQIKYYDGNLSLIDAIPDDLKSLYQEVFEIDPLQLIELTARRSKWIDQSQAHNVFMKGVSGGKLHDIYMRAWERGLKTTYYLRSLGASQIEKSTLDAGKYGYTQKRVYNRQTSATQAVSAGEAGLADAAGLAGEAVSAGEAGLADAAASAGEATPPRGT